MKVLVTGSRHWQDFDAVKFMLEEVHPDIVVHGRARGADCCAHFACEELGLTVANGRLRPYPADWVAHGSAAGPIRNQKMLDVEHTKKEPIDMCLAFPEKDSVGTWDMVERCLKAGIPVELCSDDKECEKKFKTLKEIHVDITKGRKTRTPTTAQKPKSR